MEQITRQAIRTAVSLTTSGLPVYYYRLSDSRQPADTHFPKRSETLSYSMQEIVDDITEYVQKVGGHYNDWYVGVSKDARNALFNKHKVNQKDSCWIRRQACSSQVAREVQYYFVHILGTDGGGAGGDDPGNEVYAYKKPACFPLKAFRRIVSYFKRPPRRES